MFGAFRGGLRGAAGVRSNGPRMALSVADTHTALPETEEHVDEGWLAADIVLGPDDTYIPEFSDPMTRAELDSVRKDLMATYESDSADPEIEEINPDSQMLRADNARHEEAQAVGSVMDFAMALATSTRVQNAVFSEIAANPDMNAELRRIFAEQGLRLRLGAPGLNAQNQIMAAAEQLPSPRSHPTAGGRMNPLEQLVHNVANVLGDAGHIFNEYLNRVRNTVSRFIRHMRGGKGHTSGKEGQLGDDEEDDAASGMAIVELATAVASVLVLGVLFRRIPIF